MNKIDEWNTKDDEKNEKYMMEQNKKYYDEKKLMKEFNFATKNAPLLEKISF